MAKLSRFKWDLLRLHPARRLLATPAFPLTIQILVLLALFLLAVNG